MIFGLVLLSFFFLLCVFTYSLFVVCVCVCVFMYLFKACFFSFFFAEWSFLKRKEGGSKRCVLVYEYANNWIFAENAKFSKTYCISPSPFWRDVGMGCEGGSPFLYTFSVRVSRLPSAA